MAGRVGVFINYNTAQYDGVTFVVGETVMWNHKTIVIQSFQRINTVIFAFTLEGEKADIRELSK